MDGRGTEDVERPEAADAQHLPLSHFTVIDLTRARAGPTCVRHLADWGANVICIEPPGNPGEGVTGKRDGFDFLNLHRNKKMIRLDLKAEEGHAAFMRLVEKADAVIENMRPPVKHRLKVAYEDVRAVNPKIVYGSISGFGQDGPYADRPGVDQVAQGMGGLMSVTGEPGRGPMRAGVAIDDLTAGNLLALGVVMALLDRERTGVGRWVYTSLLEAQIFMLDFLAARWLIDGHVSGQEGNNHPVSTPTGVFPTADGHINIAAANQRLWGRFCDLIGYPEWKSKPEWQTALGRLKDRPQINKLIEERTRTKPSQYWVDLLEKGGVACGPIYSIDQVFNDPQVRHLRMSRGVRHSRFGEQEVVASPLNMSGLSKDIRSATRDAGTDTDEVLREIGLTDQQIEAMHARGVV